MLAKGAFENIEPLAESLADRTDTDTTILLSGDGGIVMKQKRTYYGNEFASFRKRFSEMPPEERTRHHEELLSSISQGARPAGEYVTRYDRYPGVEEVAAQVDSYGVRQGSYLYLKVPGLVNAIEGVTSDERKSPLYLAEPRKGRIRVEVELPKGALSCEALPLDGLDIALGGGGGISMKTSLAEGVTGKGAKTVRISQDINIEPVIVPAPEYPALLDRQRTLSHPGANLLLLRMKD